MRKVLFLGIAAATMLASCSKDETVDVPQGKAIGFSNTFVDNATRSVVDPSLKTETLDKFAVYGYTQNGKIFDGTQVSKTDGKWSYTPPKYWVEGNQYVFAAIAPVKENVVVTNSQREGTSVNDYKVGMTVSFTNDGVTDLLHAAPAAIDANESFMAGPISPVAMTFNHQLSKVKFSFFNNIGSSAYKIKVTNVQITDAKKTGVLTIANGTNTWNANDVSGEVTLNFGAVGTTENVADAIMINSEGETYNEKLMIPYNNTGIYTVKFVVELFDDAISMGTYNHEVMIQNVALEPGYCYDFKATLTYENITGPDEPGLKPIEFTLDKVAEWTPGGEKDVPVSTGSTGNN